jgi:hypothetical protein
MQMKILFLMLIEKNTRMFIREVNELREKHPVFLLRLFVIYPPLLINFTE